MKMIGIDSHQSTVERTAFRLEGPFDLRAIEHFKRLVADRMETRPFGIELRNSCIFAKNPVPKGFSDLVSQLISEAEGFAAHEREVEDEREQLDSKQKDEILKRTACEQGLPIL